MRKVFDSPHGVGKGTTNMCKLIESRDGQQEVDSSQGGVKVIIKLCQVLDRCDDHGEDVRRLGEM